MKTITTKAGIFLMAVFAVFMLTQCDDSSSPNPIKPTITSINPDSGKIGSMVTIMGNNFSSEISENTVRFGKSKANINKAMETKLVVTVPSGLTVGSTYKITETVGGETAVAPDSFTVVNGKTNPGNNLKPCAIRLYDGDHFSTTDDSITVKGPGQFKTLANLPNASQTWNATADSYISGDSAAVSFWSKTNFKGDSVSFDAGSQEASLSIQPSSMKITCNNSK